MTIRLITGPTGSGKTDLAEVWARRWNLSLLNADTFQMYREIPIISNQPSPHERWRYLSYLSLPEVMSARRFSEEALAEVNPSTLIVGTGLYGMGLVYGFDEQGVKGRPFKGAPRFAVRSVVLSPPREALYERLNARVDSMMARGAEEEARVIFEKQERGEIPRSHPLLKAIGLQHWIRHWEGEWNREQMIAMWKRDSRRLAKRQWTWLRKFSPPGKDCLWIEQADDPQLELFWAESREAESEKVFEPDSQTH